MKTILFRQNLTIAKKSIAGVQLVGPIVEIFLHGTLVSFNENFETPEEAKRVYNYIVEALNE